MLTEKKAGKARQPPYKQARCPKDCLSCANSFSEAAKNNMERGGKIVKKNGYCSKYL